MELDITEKDGNKLRFKLKGEGHGFSNLLEKTLLETKGVKIAQYDIDHPELSEPNFYVETKGKKDPEKAVKESCETIKKQVEQLEKAL